MSKNKRNTRRGRRRRMNSKRRTRAFTGGRIRCPTHPPQFIPVPWYNLTVRFDSTKDLTVSGIVTQLDNQLGLSANQVIGIRIISCRYWAPLVNMNAAGHLEELRVGFWSLLPANASTAGGSFTLQQEVFDYPDQVRRACVGFVWPKAQQEIVFNRTSTQPVYHTITGGGAGSVTYIKLLWRALDVVFTTRFDGQRFINVNRSETPQFEELSIDSPGVTPS